MKKFFIYTALLLFSFNSWAQDSGIWLSTTKTTSPKIIDVSMDGTNYYLPGNFFRVYQSPDKHNGIHDVLIDALVKVSQNAVSVMPVSQFKENDFHFIFGNANARNAKDFAETKLFHENLLKTKNPENLKFGLYHKAADGFDRYFSQDILINCRIDKCVMYTYKNDFSEIALFKPEYLASWRQAYDLALSVFNNCRKKPPYLIRLRHAIGWLPPEATVPGAEPCYW